MQVTKNITLDLLETGSPVIIKAKQNDRNTRYIAAHLYVGRLDYQVPSGTEIAFRYKKPDGTAGFYDALPDNSPAITVSGNTVTVELVEQVLTVAGCVHCEINMYNAASEKLTTFTFEISVEESVLTGAEIISSDYYNLLTSEIAKALQAVTDATEQAENAAQSAQEAADSAAMSKDWAAGQPVTYSGAPVSIAYAGAQRIASITAYGETPQGGTTEAPVALTGVDSVFVSGNNLLPKAVRTETTGGITFTPNPDGSILVSGTATTNVGYSYAHFERALLGRTVCLSGGSTQAQVLINERLSSGAFVRNVLVDRGQGISGILTKQKEDNILYATIQVLAGTTVNTTIYPMLNLGESPLPYEPYQGSVTPLPIPRPLHEVGDVRDVCRTRVKSVYDKRIVLNGTENWTIFPEKPNSFRTAVSEIILSGLSDSYPTLKSSEIGTKNGVYLSYTDAIIVIDLACSTVEEFKAHLSAHPLTVYYRTAAYNGTNGLDVCLMKYQTGFVELDGTEAWRYGAGQQKELIISNFVSAPTKKEQICSHAAFEFNLKGAGFYIVENLLVFGANYTGKQLSLDEFKNYLAAQKEAGTPVQVAYQLATPEVYATEPLDFDNAAGPLTVMTGGELEVRMTELIGSRSDVSNNTVAFTETAQDADISSGEKLTVLFGKIKKRFAVIASNLSNIYNKTESDERYATAAQGEKADDALPKTGGTISGNLTVVQDLTVQRAFNGMMIKAGTKIVTTANTTNRAELFTSDQLNTLFGTSGVTYNATNSVVVVANGDYETQSKNITAGFVNSKWAIFSADGSNLLTGGLRVNYVAVKFA